MNRYLHTLGEVFNIKTFDEFISASEITDVLKSWGVTETNGADITDDIVSPNFEVLKNYVFTAHLNDYLSVFTKEENIVNSNFKVWGDLFIRVMVHAKNKYAPIVKAFEDNVTKLMDKVKSISSNAENGQNSSTDKVTSTSENQNMENDTPTTQDITEVVNLNYLTNYIKDLMSSENNSIGSSTHSINGSMTSEQDMKPIIERLSDIRDKWDDINNSWANEFNVLFIHNIDIDMFGDEEDE